MRNLLEGLLHTNILEIDVKPSLIEYLLSLDLEFLSTGLVKRV